MGEAAIVEMRPAEKPESRAVVSVDQDRGGIIITNAEQAIEMAKLMSRGGVAVRKHLRDNPGACLGIVFQAVEWRMSPYAVANKSYAVSDQLAYEAQLIAAVILQRAPIKGRLRYEYSGEGAERRCRVVATLADGTGEVDYETPPSGLIPTKNSPLWKSDQDQQLGYYAVRSLARRHFPDVILGVYDIDELGGRMPEDRPRQKINPLSDDIEGEFHEVESSAAGLPQAPGPADEGEGACFFAAASSPASNPVTAGQGEADPGAARASPSTSDPAMQPGSSPGTAGQGEDTGGVDGGAPRASPDRKTFTVPEGCTAVLDAEGRATGEIVQKPQGSPQAGKTGEEVSPDRKVEKARQRGRQPGWAA
jgi:hypothetical protein